MQIAEFLMAWYLIISELQEKRIHISTAKLIQLGIPVEQTLSSPVSDMVFLVDQVEH